eukprot:8252928-Pyramimonas_sp.AAC.1
MVWLACGRRCTWGPGGPVRASSHSTRIWWMGPLWCVVALEYDPWDAWGSRPCAWYGRSRAAVGSCTVLPCRHDVVARLVPLPSVHRPVPDLPVVREVYSVLAMLVNEVAAYLEPVFEVSSSVSRVRGCVMSPS